MKEQTESLGHILRDTSLALINMLNQEFAKAGEDMTAEQFRLLISLWAKDEQTQNELGENIGKYKTSVTRLVDGLEKRGLIQRVQQADDRRSNVLKLTRKGKDIRTKLQKIQRAVVQHAQEQIDPKHLEICRKVLLKMQENISSQ